MLQEEPTEQGNFPSDFMQAAKPLATSQTTISLPLDNDVLAWLQADNQPSDWRAQINGLMRYYMETSLIMEADAELARQAAPEPARP